MLVVPLEKDRIVTKDQQLYTVVEYTNLKDGGPAVYAKIKGQPDLVLVYFFDIEKINKTSVEYQKSSKVFNALGRITRVIHLPQPDDKVTFVNSEEQVDMKGLKLKSKSLGENRGLFIQSSDGEYYRAKEILNIDRSLGGSNFDRELFLKLYHDYLGG